MHARIVLGFSLTCAALAAQTSVQQANKRFEEQAGKAPAAVSIEFRLRAAQALKERYPDQARRLVEATLAELRGDQGWVLRVDAVGRLLKEVAPDHGIKLEPWSLKLPPPDPEISRKLGTMRALPTDADRARVVLEVAPQIRALPAEPGKVRLARGLASLTTEGDLGAPALTAAATTLAAAMRETYPQLMAAKQGWPYGESYLEVASLVRYEHVDAGPMDASLQAALRLFELREQLLQDAGFALASMDGKPYSLASLKGRIVLLNFWATWCPPCRKEMPDMEKLYRKYGSKGLTVLAVSDEKRETVEGFLAKNPYSFPVLLDADHKVNKDFGIEGIPKSFIFDREGKLAAQAIDMRTEKQFMELLKRAGLE
jgi:peroxiredoxin